MNVLRKNIFTGNPMSRYEFAIRFLAEGAAGPNGGVYSAGTLIMVSALFSSIPPDVLIRLGENSTPDDLRLFRTVSRRLRGKLKPRDRDGSGPWPHYRCGVRDFLAREVYVYGEKIRKSLMAERVAAGYPEHDNMFVMPAADSSEIAAPYSREVLGKEFRRALDVMKDRYPQSYLHYKAELPSVDSLTSFLRWTITADARVVDDPLTDIQATLLLFMNSPVRIELGDAMRYLDKITDEYIAKQKLPGLGGSP